VTFNGDGRNVRVGVIGAGNIGADHATTLAREVAGAEVVAVFDPDPARAAAVAEATQARTSARAEELISAPDVDSVLVASPDETHPAMVLACIAAGKPVLCEKPLATSLAGATEVMEAEIAHGARLVRLGFMRRYDPGYRAAKEVIAAGELGQVVVLHCVHRGKASAPHYTTAMLLSNSAVHEFDVTRWLLGEEIVAASVVAGRSSPYAPVGLHDPLIVLLETSSGVVVDIELFCNCRYGYDVRCEVVGTDGTICCGEPASTFRTATGWRRSSIADDWRARFHEAYRAELQDWVESLRRDEQRGPTAWDGYAATAVAEACVAAAADGARAKVELGAPPSLYR